MIGRRAAFAAAMVAAIGWLASPAAAQITFGSPGDPAHLGSDRNFGA